jgi:hypothetical protein
VPPVDQKFATEMKAVSEMSTSDLLDAYTANAAAMYHNARSLGSNPPELDGPLSLQLRHEAMRIREHLTTGWPDSAMQILEMEAPSRNEAEVVEERRGQRVRSGKGGATTNLRKSLQRNLNVVSASHELVSMTSLSFFFGVNIDSSNIIFFLNPELARDRSQLSFVHLFWSVRGPKHNVQKPASHGCPTDISIAIPTNQDLVETGLLRCCSSSGYIVEPVASASAGDSLI